MTVEDKARGEGQGVGGNRQGDGGTSVCVCPKCGAESPHERGTPCNKRKCPKCKQVMKDEWDECVFCKYMPLYPKEALRNKR